VKICAQCLAPLERRPGEQLTNYRQRRFCDKSCSAAFNNRFRNRQIPDAPCPHVLMTLARAHPVQYWAIAVSEEPPG